MKLTTAISLGLALVLLSSGCAHYSLGTQGRLAFRTLYVEPIVNRTAVPQAHALVSTALRQEFLRDGRVILVNSAAEADVTVSVTLVDYHREVVTVRPDDTGLARAFALTLGSTVTLHDNRRSQNLFAQRPLKVARDAYTDSGQLQAEYQAFPLLAESLSRRVAHTVLDVW